MYKYVAVDMYASLFMLLVILLTAARGGGINDYTLLGESGKLLLVIGHEISVGN